MQGRECATMQLGNLDSQAAVVFGTAGAHDAAHADADKEFLKWHVLVILPGASFDGVSQQGGARIGSNWWLDSLTKTDAAWCSFTVW